MNTRRFIVLSVACIIPMTTLLAQSPYEKWIDYNNESDGYGKLFKTEFGYLAFTGFVPLETYLNGYMVTGLDINGEVLFQKPYSSDEEYWGFFDGANMIESIDSGYYCIIIKYTEETNFNPVLVRFNDLGDTLWTKELLTDLPDRVHSFVPIQNSDSTLSFFGNHSPTANDDITPWTQIFLKTDVMGNYLWHEEYDGQQTIFPMCAIEVEDGYVVGGNMQFTQNNEVWDHQYRQFQRKFLNDGTESWYTTIKTPPAGAEAPMVSLLPLTNGNYLYAGGRSAGVLSGSGETSNVKIQPVIGEIDSETGDTLWEHGFNFHARYQQFFSLKTTSDGGYIGVGTHRFVSEGETAGWPVGFIAKINADFEEEWYHYYIPQVWEGMGRWNNLTDVVENDNGTYTAIGMIYTNTGDGPQNGFIQDTYLLTVDSVGCIVEGCNVGMTEFDNAIGVFLYPNPTKDIIHINLPRMDTYSLSIFNSMGNLVVQTNVRQMMQTTITTNELSDGIYTLVCWDADGNSWSEIFVKE